MSSSVCTSRLRKEYKEIQRKPVENILTCPRETNILEWHYVITGPKGSPYEGGHYHGIVTFPSNYPYKPPSIQMLTPNGRFKPNTRLCLSMSDFHPETWNPMWSVGTILMGLYSFMLEESPTYGSISTTDTFKRKCAKESLEFNIKNKVFRELFPDLVELHHERLKATPPEEILRSNNSSSSSSSAAHSSLVAGDEYKQQQPSWLAVLGVFAAICACTWAVLKISLL